MPCLAGHVSLQTSGAIDTSSQNSATSPSPFEPRDQRQLWDEYTIFFSALFAPGKYATEGSLDLLTFEQAATAILENPKLQ
jgi:hypothetical protein